MVSNRTPLAGAAGILLLLSAAAAQSAPADEAPAANAGELQEVVVTATRREESLSKVSVSVSAYTSEKMETIGVKNIQDVARFTPGLSFGANQTNDISIRGIASTAGAGTTGIYIDDTPIQIRNLGGFDNDDSLPGIFDLDRIEVLRGPQGTLFGAGSEGGTVRYIMTQPSLTKFSTYGRSELAFTKYGQPTYEAGIAAGGPIVEDKFGARASVWYRRDGGWIDRVDTATGNVVDKNSNHAGTVQVRLAATWAPISNLSITPSVLYQNRKSHDVSIYNAVVSDPGDGLFINTNPDARRQPDKFYLPSLKIDWDMGPVRLISNSSVFHRKELSGYDGTIYNLSFYQNAPDNYGFDFPEGSNFFPLLTSQGPRYPAGFENYRSPALVTNRQENVTQEFRVQSNDPDARFTWTAGVFLSVNRQRSVEEIMDPMLDDFLTGLFGVGADEFFGVDPGTALVGPNLDSYINDLTSHDRQYAVFGEGNFAITDRLKLIAGARYSKTKFDFHGHSDGGQNGGPLDSSGDQSEKPFTPKAGLSFQYDPDNLYYATWAKGFRIGGASPPLPQDAGCVFPPSGAFKSDTVKSTEIGAKNLLFDRLRLASSAYYIQWNDIQQLIIDPGCQITTIKNLGKAKVQGIDVQADFLVTDHLTAETALGYTHARYRKRVGLDVPDDPSTPDDETTSGTLVSKGDAIGVPPWTATLGLQYNFEAFGRQSFVRGDYEHTAGQERTQYQNPTNGPQDVGSFTPFQFRSPSTNFVSFRAGMTIDDWSIAAFVDNAFNALRFNYQTYSQAGYLDTSDPSVIQFDEGGFRPRTIGITVSYRH